MKQAVKVCLKFDLLIPNSPVRRVRDFVFVAGLRSICEAGIKVFMPCRLHFGATNDVFPTAERPCCRQVPKKNWRGITLQCTFAAPSLN